MILTVSILISILFLGIGFYHKSKIVNLKEFFYYKEPNNKRKLIISLTAANLTLGTGLVYLAQGGFSNGVLFLIVPIALFFGYSLLGKFLKWINYTSEKNYFDFIDSEISKSHKTIFKKSITIILLITFLLVISFEVYASSNILAPLIFNSSELFYQILIAAVIIIVALIYSITAGMRGVIKSDIFQIFFIVLAVLFLIFGNTNLSFENMIVNFEDKIIFDNSTIWLVVILAALNSISTQFYSILNHGIISNSFSNDRIIILKKTGIFSAILLMFFIFFGLLLPSGNAPLNFTELLSHSYSNFALIIIALGFLSIIYSTLDSLLIIISMFFYQNVLNKEISESSGKKEINHIRAIISISFIIIFLLLAFIYYYNTSLFYLLLGIGSGITVIVPLIILSGIYYKRGEVEKIKNSQIWVFLFLFIFAHVVYLTGMTFPSFNSLLPYISYSFFTISILYTLIIYRVNKN